MGLRRDTLRDVLDAGGVAGALRKTAIAGDQRKIEGFGEGNVGGVVGGDVLAEGPDAKDERFD